MIVEHMMMMATATTATAEPTAASFKECQCSKAERSKYKRTATDPWKAYSIY